MLVVPLVPALEDGQESGPELLRARPADSSVRALASRLLGGGSGLHLRGRVAAQRRVQRPQVGEHLSTSGLRPGALYASYTFRYGPDVQLEFPLGDLVALALDLALGGGMDQFDLVDVLWDDFLRDTRSVGLVDGVQPYWGYSKALTGCWSMPSGGVEHFVVLTSGWGAPAWLWAYALGMLAAYAEDFHDESSASDAGEGLSGFIESFLSGGEPRRSKGHSSRPDVRLREVYFDFPAYDTRYPAAGSPNVADCGQYGVGGSEYCGPPYDSFLLELEEGGFPDYGPVWNIGSVWNLDDYYETCTEWLDVFDDPHVTPSMVMPARVLWVEGQAHDVMLMWAWLAVTYFRNAGDVTELLGRYSTHLAPARLLGRWCLRRLEGLSSFLGFGFATIYNYGSRVERDCFGSYAAAHYSCAVRARLGLGSSSIYLIDGRLDDPPLNTGCAYAGITAASVGGMIDCGVRPVCHVDEVGRAGSAYVYCALPSQSSAREEVIDAIAGGECDLLGACRREDTDLEHYVCCVEASRGTAEGDGENPYA